MIAADSWAPGRGEEQEGWVGPGFDLIDRSRWGQIADPVPCCVAGPSLPPCEYKALQTYGRTLKAFSQQYISVLL